MACAFTAFVGDADASLTPDSADLPFGFDPASKFMEDRTLLSTFDVTNTADSGSGSLRQAILDSNAATGQANTIDFSIPGDGVQTLAPISPLPAITQSVLIDGFSQPGYAGTPLIELSGSQAGGGDGLSITGSNVTVRGLDIGGYSQGAGIHLTGTSATGDWIYGNFLGTDPSGTQAVSNEEGVEIDGGATNNTIGETTAGAGNVISANGAAGIWITGAGTTGVVVQDNFIGTDVSGTKALGNAYAGVEIADSAWNNTIGGTAAGDRNVISGGVEGGVFIHDSAAGNLVAGNYIGTDLTGTKALGNELTGVEIADSARNNTIGGTAAGDRNLISGSPQLGGVFIHGSATGNLVAGNYIGTDVSGTKALGNALIGVEIADSASKNTIGGTAAGDRNLISGSVQGGGVLIDGSATGNLVAGNYIGTDLTGTKALGNALVGVEIADSASNNTIGGTAAGDRNLISGSLKGGGVFIHGSCDGQRDGQPGRGQLYRHRRHRYEGPGKRVSRRGDRRGCMEQHDRRDGGRRPQPHLR